MILMKAECVAVRRARDEERDALKQRFPNSSFWGGR